MYIIEVLTRCIFVFTQAFCWKETVFSLCLHVPKFFVQLLVYPVTVFCLGIPEMQVSHTCIESWKQHLSCSVKTLLWDVVGELVPYINGYYFNTCYPTLFPLVFFFFFELWLDWILFCGLRVVVGWVICQIGCILVFFFLVHKSFRLR